MDDTKVQGKITEDSLWVERWGKALSEHIPGMEIMVRVIHVESQGPPPPTDRDLDQLLEDEEEARREREERQLQMEAEEAQRCREEECHLAQAELAWHTHQAALLQDWEDWAVHDEMQKPPEPPRKRTRRVCRFSMEVASGSTDVPRVAHVHTFDIPEDGELNLRMVARMEDCPDDADLPTTRATAPGAEVGQTDNAIHSELVDHETMGETDFNMYQEAYGQWENGGLSDQDVYNRFGRDVLLMMQAQFATTQGPDLQDLRGEAHGPPTLKKEQSLDRGFGHFESAYGRWKEGTDSSSLVLERHGPGWLRLFRQWRKHGLDSIWDELKYHVKMRDDSIDKECEGPMDAGDAIAVTLPAVISQEEMDTVPWGVPLLDTEEKANVELHRAQGGTNESPEGDGEAL